MNARTLSALAVAGLLLSPFVSQATSHDHGHAASAQQAALAEGEIRKVDKDAKKLTIRHGPIENLEMPPMTMVFQVRDPAMLDKVKAGDRIRFSADRVNGAYTVTQLEPTK